MTNALTKPVGWDWATLVNYGATWLWIPTPRNNSGLDWQVIK
jgi:hypothetical protein